MKKSLQLLAWILVFQFVGFAMGRITDAGVDPWYQALTKSSLTPPGYVFGMVWAALYTMLAIVGWYLFHKQKSNRYYSLRLFYVAQLILNWLWTPLFFYFHAITAALLCLLTIVILTSRLLVLAFRRSPFSFWMLLPYWIWVCFASYLNMVIWLSNS